MHTAATFLTLRIPAFEAAIRKALDSSLARRPVVIVTAFKQLGRVIAACPDARAHGIAEEMHFPAARVRCPDAAFHLPDRRLDARAMRALLARAGKYSPLVEAAGGGRVFLDIRGTEKLLGDNCHVADALRREVATELRLPATAGLATCRPWSLLASRAADETGVCLVPPGRENAFLEQAPVGWVDGLTPRVRTLLTEMNIRMLGQIRDFSRAELVRLFGRASGDTLWNVISPRKWDAVSLLSDETLLEMEANCLRLEAALTEASVVKEKLRIVVRELTAQAAALLRAKKLGAARLRLTLLHADGAFKTVAGKTGGFVQEEAVLQRVAEQLLARAFVRRVQASRLWLDADRLSEPARQGVLFSPRPAEENAALPHTGGRRNTEQLMATVDRIHSRYGSGAVQPAVLLRAGTERAKTQATCHIPASLEISGSQSQSCRA